VAEGKILMAFWGTILAYAMKGIKRTNAMHHYRLQHGAP
jgi:hypothetical protein